MPIDLHLLGRDDAHLLGRVAPGVFDNPMDTRWTREFLDDPRHHMVIALDDGMVVGMASAMHYVHPDKPPALWINEVGVADAHRNQGIGRRLLKALLEHGRTLGCTEAWLGTGVSNTAARRMYVAAGGEQDEEDAVIYWFRM